MNILSRAARVLSHIKYRDWFFTVTQSGNNQYYLQAEFIAEDADNGNKEMQSGRKWLLSEHMTDSEIIQTAFLAVKTAEEHEMREHFKYKDEAIFGPHFNLNDIAWNIKDKKITLDKRFDPRLVTEAG